MSVTILEPRPVKKSSKKAHDLGTREQASTQQTTTEQAQLHYTPNKDNYSSGGEIPAWYEKTKNSPRLLRKVLAEHLKNKLDIICVADDFKNYTNGYYKSMNENSIELLIESNLINSATMQQVRDVKHMFKNRIVKEVSETNSKINLINFKNTCIDIENGFKENSHSKEYLSTIQFNANYDKSAKCEKWLKFIGEVLHEDNIIILQEIMGYLLTQYTKSQKAFMFYGKGGSGKSTILKVIAEILGKQNISAVPFQKLADKFTTYELYGKIANICADLPSTIASDVGQFKMLVDGEDLVRGEAKGKDGFNFQNKARLVFSCNSIPKCTSDRTDGFYRRLLIIPFNEPKPVAERDSFLLEKLLTEIDGIVQWALVGLKRLIDNNYKISENDFTKEVLEHYKVENNNVLSFIEECCVIGDELKISSKELYENYTEYCINNGFGKMNNRNFSQEIQNNSNCEKKVIKLNGKSTNGFQGIGLESDLPFD